MYYILEHNFVKCIQKLLLLKTCVVKSRFNDNALSALYRFSIWAFLMCDMHYIFDLLNFAFPFLIKELIIISVHFCGWQILLYQHGCMLSDTLT